MFLSNIASACGRRGAQDEFERAVIAEPQAPHKAIHDLVVHFFSSFREQFACAANHTQAASPAVSLNQRDGDLLAQINRRIADMSNLLPFIRLAALIPSSGTSARNGIVEEKDEFVRDYAEEAGFRVGGSGEWIAAHSLGMAASKSARTTSPS